MLPRRSHQPASDCKTLAKQQARQKTRQRASWGRTADAQQYQYSTAPPSAVPNLSDCWPPKPPGPAHAVHQCTYKQSSEAERMAPTHDNANDATATLIEEETKTDGEGVAAPAPAPTLVLRSTRGPTSPSPPPTRSTTSI